MSVYVANANDLLKSIISVPTIIDYQPYLSKQRRKIKELEALIGVSGAELCLIDRPNVVPRVLTGAGLIRMISCMLLHYLQILNCRF